MGSIIISWALWNYKFVLLVLSGIAVTEKYRIIDEVLFSSWQHVYLQGALYPLITSLLYIYAYPYPAKYVFEFSRNRQKEISDIKRKIEEETLLTVKESRTIRREMYALEEELQKDLERENSEIERLVTNGHPSIRVTNHYPIDGCPQLLRNYYPGHQSHQCQE